MSDSKSTEPKKHMKYDNDRQRYIMRRARALAKGEYGHYHHESSSFGVLILDEEGFKELRTLTEKGYLHYNNNPHRMNDRGWMLAYEWRDV